METEILFTQPSFFNGVSRTLDLWGSYDSYNESFSPVEADRLALNADIVAVEKDFNAAFDKCRQEVETEKS